MEREALASVLDELAENIHGLLGNRLDKIVLYGSYARGDNSGESDVDMIDKKAYEEWMAVTPFYQNIEKDGVIIYAA